MLAAGHLHGPMAAVRVGLAGFGADAMEGQAGVVCGDRLLGRAVDEFDAFLDRPLELHPTRRYLVGAPAVDHLDRFAAGQSQRHPAGVHGDIAAADDHHGLGHFGPRPGVDPAQELDAVDDAPIVFAGNPHGFPPPGADGQQHGVVAALEFGQGDVAPERRIEVYIDPRTALHEPVHVLFDDAHRQAEGGNPPAHHAARAVGHFIDIDLEAGDREIMGGDQPGRAGADDGDALRSGYRNRRRLVGGAQLVHDEALEAADLQGAVGRRAPAGGLAGGVADPPADRGERVGVGDRLEGLGVFAFPDIGDVGRRVGAHRTGDLTGRRDEMEIAGVVGKLVLGTVFLGHAYLGHVSRPCGDSCRGIPARRAAGLWPPPRGSGRPGRRGCRSRERG